MRACTVLFGNETRWGGGKKKTYSAPLPSGLPHLHLRTHARTHSQTAYVSTKPTLTVDANPSSTFTAEQVQELRRPNYSRDPQRMQAYKQSANCPEIRKVHHLLLRRSEAKGQKKGVFFFLSLDI